MSRQSGGEFAIRVRVVDGRKNRRMGSGSDGRKRGGIAIRRDDFDVDRAVRAGRGRVFDRARFLERELFVGGGLVVEARSENGIIVRDCATMAGGISASGHL